MWPNPKFPTDLVKFTEEIFNWKLHFSCRVTLTEKNFSDRKTKGFGFYLSNPIEIQQLSRFKTFKKCKEILVFVIYHDFNNSLSSSTFLLR